MVTTETQTSGSLVLKNWRKAALVLTGLDCGLALVVAPLTIAANSASDHGSMLARLRLAARDGFSQSGFDHFVSSFDPAVLAIARRFDPAAKAAPATSAPAVAAFPELSPQAADTQMTPERALAVNNAIPFSPAPIQTATPFTA